MDLSNIVVCSFHTADEYYRGHARSLRKNLESIGVVHELEEIEKSDGEDWADICRKKIGFLARVCDENPDKKIFWIDVDCNLLELPQYIAEFTADIIGFQRGFSSPLRIGYVNRTRFWEPCFFGINTTPAARKFIQDAHTLEQSMEIKATDDYFFEESWRSNASHLSFQVIPSLAVLSKADGNQDVPVFFTFGSSGSVKEFKGSVVQHDHVNIGATMPLRRQMRRRALRSAKFIEQKLPAGVAASLRKVADNIGITDILTGGALGLGGLSGNDVQAGSLGSPHRNSLVKEMVMAAHRADAVGVEGAFARLTSNGISSKVEATAKQAADTFLYYAGKNTTQDPIRLAWWPRPFPGNFGDWLSPLVLDAQTSRSIAFQSPTSASRALHITAVGSIGRFIKASSIVVGTGISSTDFELDRKAHYVSVRGPITAAQVRASGGPSVESLGDPGALISRIIPIDRGLTNGKFALVRHHKHINLPVVVPDGMDELSVLLSHPAAIRSFVTELNQYDAVVTSAMHVMIACHSYGIPCALITFEGFESSVHGSGMKYRDYSLGAGLSAVHEPSSVPLDLRRANVESLVTKEEIGPSKLDEIEQAVHDGISLYISRSE